MSIRRSLRFGWDAPDPLSVEALEERIERCRINVERMRAQGREEAAKYQLEQIRRYTARISRWQRYSTVGRGGDR